MKAKIIKASKPTYWYAHSIGEMYSAQGEPVQMYTGGSFDYVCEDGEHFIFVDDCEIVEERTADS